MQFSISRVSNTSRPPQVALMLFCLLYRLCIKSTERKWAFRTECWVFQMVTVVFITDSYSLLKNRYLLFENLWFSASKLRGVTRKTFETFERWWISSWRQIQKLTKNEQISMGRKFLLSQQIIMEKITHIVNKLETAECSVI